MSDVVQRHAVIRDGGQGLGACGEGYPSGMAGSLGDWFRCCVKVKWWENKESKSGILLGINSWRSSWHVPYLTLIGKGKVTFNLFASFGRYRVIYMYYITLYTSYFHEDNPCKK